MYSTKLLTTEFEGAPVHLKDVGRTLPRRKVLEASDEHEREGYVLQATLCGKTSMYGVSVLRKMPMSRMCTDCVEEANERGINLDSMVTENPDRES